MTSAITPVTILASAEDGYPQWENANRQNTSQCPIYRLPNELMVAIMDISVHDDTRICIGREGSVRLCSHLSVNWAELDLRPRSHERDCVPSESVIRCLHPSHESVDHIFASYPRRTTPNSTISSRPSLAIFKMFDKEFDTTSVHTVRRCKIHSFDLAPSRPVTMKHLQRHLELRQAHPKDGDFALCPHVP
ncbi:hypothetical protein B0T26DRAFT_735262 [Lasiosphaeria miniovina]|uniref:Uncharacterized protein n=1 Tax=Lasiosphaeria miniovina TaxID=1954250 RepID=A0AA40DFV8_9PEZI|nr:uncharacterized protein B0T26DRAFT_735262 [Lasiosphaeria miniovina]KAK0701929.1 hypothetical protein B0T26DRAFT_735262 [Lasiosphaeria miniovina]